jgi:hypothetical protein
VAKRRLTGSDQPFKDANLIGKAALNVLEPSGCRRITGVEKERLHFCDEHIGFTQKVVRLR